MAVHEHTAPQGAALGAVTRRTLLRVSPGLVLPLLAVSALADADTTILRLFHEWDELQHTGNGLPDAEADAWCETCCELERRIEAEPITCLADLAAKVVASTGYGDFGVAKSVVAECEAILAGGAA